jgi:type IV secretory pathway VirB4 component
MVIDPEREYQYLTETVGGAYFNISLTSPNHINPFDLPIPREDESPSDVLRSNIINLVGFFRILLGGLTPQEDSILDSAITETYAARDITPDTDFSTAVPPTLSDLELVLASTEGGEDLAVRLKKYTQGTWAGFLNQQTNIDVRNRLVVFSVRDMEEELRPIAMYIVLHYIWNTVRSELKKRLLVVDEAWWLMRYEDGASFLYAIAKRARKYFLGLSTITQDVADFMGSPYGKPLVTNSSLQLLLKQSPATIRTVVETFNLTEEEKFLLLESAVGEGIFFAGLKHVAIKIIASYTEDQVITSDPQQLLLIKQAKEEFSKMHQTEAPSPPRELVR